VFEPLGAGAAPGLSTAGGLGPGARGDQQPPTS
jgi:hypothetical protein